MTMFNASFNTGCIQSWLPAADARGFLHGIDVGPHRRNFRRPTQQFQTRQKLIVVDRLFIAWCVADTGLSIGSHSD